MPAAAISVKSLTKSFAGVRALEDVSANFFSGEIHAVVGENGAGKSTLMRLITGELRPDRGLVEFGGARKVGMVHQHFMLVPAFTVAENLALSSPRRRPILRAGEDCLPALELSRSLGWNTDPDEKVAAMSVGSRQRLEILRALAPGPDILILDEPTAVLAPSEVEELLAILRNLKAQGRTILLIAHKLDEVLAVADRISVLRGGRLVGTFAASEIDAQGLAEKMLGEAHASKDRDDNLTSQDELVNLRDISVLGDEGNVAVAGLSETICRGEVLGIGGVDGNGQIELAEAVAGVRPHSGEIGILGSKEVAYIPQDRQRDGLALNLSVLENFAIEGHRRFKAGFFLNIRALSNWAIQLIKAFRIKADRLDAPARTLSGGNQQKVVVSRVLDGNPGLIVAVNPTRGLDVRAAGEVLEAIREQARSGAAVLLISTDRDELAEVSNRIRFLGRGRLYDDFESALAGGHG